MGKMIGLPWAHVEKFYVGRKSVHSRDRSRAREEAPFWFVIALFSIKSHASYCLKCQQRSVSPLIGHLASAIVTS